MKDIVNRFEKVIYAVLMIMLMAILVAGIIDLGFILITSLTNIPSGLLEAHEMIAVLGGCLLVLIAIELLDTIKAYFFENIIHVEIVVLLAIIAVARKVILLDPTGMSGTEYGIQLIGIGVIIAGFAGGYYLIKKEGISSVPETMR